jgi:hypothetical protein
MSMMQLPQANSLVPVQDLIALNNVLRKAATGVGYQTPTDVTAAGGLSALVPQSIEGSLSSATFTMKELVFWPALAKTKVGQTVHEFNVIEEHGMDLDPFLEEGGSGANNRTTYSRNHVKVKFLSERREVTDVATTIGLLGPNSSAIAEATNRGTLRLMQKLEHSLFHASEAVNPLAFDGVFTQLEAAGGNNITDMGGDNVSPDVLQYILGEMGGAPKFGRPDCIYVEPRIHSDLIRQTVAHGRHDQVSKSGSALTFGKRDIMISGPYGDVPVKSAPFLFTAYAPPTAASSADTGVPKIPEIGIQPAAGAHASSKFVTTDAGDYIYKILAMTKKGYSAPLETAVVSVVAGDRVTIEIDKTSYGQLADAWYKVYRSDKDSTTEFSLLVEMAANATGTAGAAQIFDANAVKTRSSKILFANHSSEIMEVARLLDMIRRPLAEVATSKPFLLMLFASLMVKVPSKLWMMKNVIPTPTDVSI